MNKTRALARNERTVNKTTDQQRGRGLKYALAVSMLTCVTIKTKNCAH